MFVTDEERLPLGGRAGWLLGFFVPMILVGAGAGWALFQLGASEEDRFYIPLAYAGLGTALGLLTFYHASRLRSIVIALIIGGGFFSIARLLESGMGFEIAILQIIVLLSLGYGSTLMSAASKQDGIISWRPYFLGLTTVPILITVAALFVGALALIAFLLGEGVLDRGLAETFTTFQGRLPSYIIAGAVAGSIISIVRTQKVLIGAVRYGLLLAGRYGLPFIVVLTLVSFAASWQSGAFVMDQFGGQTPVILASLLASVMILTYNTGENPPPVFWVRMFFWLAVLVLGVLAAVMIMTNAAVEPVFVDAIYQDTAPPKRDMLGWAMPGLFALVAGAGAIGMVTDLRKNAARWMPPFGPILLWGSLTWLVAVVITGVLSA